VRNKSSTHLEGFDFLTQFQFRFRICGMRFVVLGQQTTERWKNIFLFDFLLCS